MCRACSAVNKAKQNQVVKGREEIGVLALIVGFGVVLEVAILLLTTLIWPTDGEFDKQASDGDNNGFEYVQYCILLVPSLS